MRSIKGRNTNPELVVRRIAHQMGYRFRLHHKDLPGTPDLTFVSRRKVVLRQWLFLA
jgi:DNA mismatch endonuclease (patch repair protein)